MSVDYEAVLSSSPVAVVPATVPERGNGRARALDERRRHPADGPPAPGIGHLGRSQVVRPGRRPLFTGLRLAQVQGLRVQDCDLEGRTLRIYRRPIPHLLTPEGVEVLAGWLARGDLGGSEWVFPGTTLIGPWWGGRPGDKPLDRLPAAAEEVGLGHVTFVALRHLFQRCHGRIVLGEEFRSLRPPEQISEGPQPRPPGPGRDPAGRNHPISLAVREARMAAATGSRPPTTATPGPPVATPETTITVAFGPGDQATILGRPKELTKAGRRVIKALLDAGRDGLRTTQLQTVCGGGRGIVRRLIESDPDWAAVIHRDMEGKRVRRYRIGPPGLDGSEWAVVKPTEPRRGSTLRPPGSGARLGDSLAMFAPPASPATRKAGQPARRMTAGRPPRRRRSGTSLGRDPRSPPRNLRREPHRPHGGEDTTSAPKGAPPP